MKWNHIVIGVMLCASMGCSALMGPNDLRVGEGFSDPLGFHDSTPSFSWKLPVGVEKQTAYQLVVKKQRKTVWDSGWVESGQSVFVPYSGEPLASRDRVEWRVRYRDENGKESAWSKTARFELGLLSNNDWTANWIRPADPVAETVTDFKLIKAVYRSKAHPATNKDVTELLREKTDDSGFSVRVVNDELGGDPAYNEVKELLVTCRANGKTHTLVVDENQTAAFPSHDERERVGLLRRGFTVAKTVDHARIYVTARGLFDLYLNGKRVGNDHFAQGFTSYHKRLDTLTYDVTHLLKSSGNLLEAKLGQGWYAGRFPFADREPGYYGKHAELLLQLEITYADGSRETIVSDGQWEGTFEGPIVASSIYDGEVYDARRTPSDWKPVVVNTELGSAVLQPKPFAPVREMQTVAVQSISEPEPGRFVFDLGQNMVGWARIKVPAETDKTITLRFAEMLNKDGTLYTKNYRSAKSTDTYTAASTGTIEFEPHFTFHGFRYVELSGLPSGVKPKKEWVTGVVLHSDQRKIGSFESSHAKLNQLQRNIVWGWHGNSVDIPTDCPQRDERLGWTGDAQVFCPTSLFNEDSLAFWKSWLGSLRDDQYADGRIPHVIPNVIGGGDSPGWMDAATFIPWEVYVRTGDREVLADNYEMMERLVGWYRGQVVDGLTPNIRGFGDWLQPYAANTSGETPYPLLGLAFYARSCALLAQTATVLGKTADADRYASEAATVRKAFAAHYFDVDGRLQNARETQTVYLLAIAFDLLPVDLQEKAATHLVRLVEEADGHLRTGFLGTPYITRVLDRVGRSDLALSVLFTETYPSWFFSINQGATTMWERWNSYTLADGFGDAGMNSFNHYAYGAIGQWMYERLAGLAPDPSEPGYKHFFVRPLIAPQLDWARAQLETPYGQASSGWARKNGKVVMEVIVPPNTTATVVFPDGRQDETVPAGIYHFQLKR